MILFDEIIRQIEVLTKEGITFNLTNISPCKEGSKDQILFKNDTAFELGGSPLPGLGVELVTEKDFDDEVILLGKDLSEIKSDTSLAKIIILSIDGKAYEDSDKAYQAIRQIEYVKYHMYLDNMMIRVSPLTKKESLRVGKNVIKEKVSLANVGKYFIDSYKKECNVKNCKVIFINNEDFDYKNLESLINKSSNMISALDHLSKKVNMDCTSCHLKVVCEEVEKLSK